MIFKMPHATIMQLHDFLNLLNRHLASRGTLGNSAAIRIGLYRLHFRLWFRRAAAQNER
jgi:hypothetical protein